LLTLKIVFGKRRFNAIRLPMVISVLDHAHAPGFSGLRLFVVFLPGWLLILRRIILQPLMEGELSPSA
jgi:hypothetical protein